MPVIDNVNRVQGNFVSQSRRRWFINVVLVLAVIGFVGFSLFPLIIQHSRKANHRMLPRRFPLVNRQWLGKNRNWKSRQGL